MFLGHRCPLAGRGACYPYASIGFSLEMYINKNQRKISEPLLEVKTFWNWEENICFQISGYRVRTPMAY